MTEKQKHISRRDAASKNNANQNCKLCYGRGYVFHERKGKTTCDCYELTDEEKAERAMMATATQEKIKQIREARRVVHDPRPEDQPVLRG